MSLTADERRVLEALAIRGLRVPDKALEEIAGRAVLSPLATRRVLEVLEARTPPLVFGTDDDGEPLVDAVLGIRFWTISPHAAEALEEG